MFNRKEKQPISLKWKWGFLLFIVFVTLSVVSLGLFHYQQKVKQYDYLIASTQLEFEKIQAIVRSTQTEKALMEQNLEATQALLNAVEDDEATLRFFNASNQLVYESRYLELPANYAEHSIESVHHNKQLLLVGNQTLTNHLGVKIGTFQYVVQPKRYLALDKQQEQFFVQLLIGAIIVSAVLGFGLAQYLLRPLNYLNNTLDLVEEESLSSLRVRKPHSEDEWSDLNVHINRLLDKIDGYVQNQKQFVEDVSHELRTPVAIVEGHLKMLDRWGKKDPTILEESISASLQEITRMKDLVQMMLDLSRADHVDVDYKDEITELYSVTRQVVNNFTILYPNFQFFLDSEDEGKELFVKMYRNHFEQILIILLDNAVKYSTDRPEIHIAVSKNFTTVEIAVQDFGEGMSDEDKQKVFGRFYRVDKARSREKGGNGLGLSIAKQLVETYKGKIYVESVLHNGSIFYIEFPIIVDKGEIQKRKNISLKKQL